MQRISDKEWLFGLPAESGENVAGTAKASVESSQRPASSDWVDGIGRTLTQNNVEQAGEELKRLSNSINSRPLFKRVIDYAQRAILVPAIVRSEETLKRFARRTAILASFLYAEWEDKDPAKIPDEELEASYRRMVVKAKAIPGAENVVRDLISALGRFHSYMRNCHGKRRLSDKGLLVPIRLLDRVDVDLLTHDEYSEVRRRIRIRWPGTQNEDRRAIASSLVILGAAGLRREEARLARICDIQFDGWKEVRIQPSEGHTLKSDSALRKIAGEAIPECDLTFLEEWRAARLLSGAGEYDRLFGTKEFECISPAVFKAVNQIISKGTGTRSDVHPTHFHHLRHSFCSWGLIRLLLPVDAELPDYFSASDRNWLISGQNFRPHEIRRTDQPWNSDVFLMSQLLGHLQPSTTISQYFRFGSELLRIYLARSVDLPPTPDQLKLAMGIGADSEVEKCDAVSAMKFAVDLLGRIAKSNQNKTAAKTSPMKGQSAEFLEELLDAWDFRSAVETADNSVDEAVADFGLSLSHGRSIQRAAADLSEMRSGNGAYRHRFMDLNPGTEDPLLSKRSIIPIRPSSPYDIEIMKTLAPGIHALSRRSKNRELLMRGIDAYVNWVWFWESCPVFPNPEENGNEATAFFKLLRALRVCTKDIRFGSFDCKGSDSRRRWREILELSQRFQFEPWEAPHGDGDSKRPWLAIKPTFKFDSPNVESPGLFGFRFLIVMSFIVLRAKTCERPQ